MDRGAWRASQGTAKSQVWLKRPSSCSVHSLLLLIPSFSDAIAFVSPGSISISFHHLNWPSPASSDNSDYKVSKPGSLGSPHTGAKTSQVHHGMAKGSENSWLPVTAGSGRVITHRIICVETDFQLGPSQYLSGREPVKPRQVKR